MKKVEEIIVNVPWAMKRPTVVFPIGIVDFSWKNFIFLLWSLGWLIRNGVEWRKYSRYVLLRVYGRDDLNRIQDSLLIVKLKFVFLNVGRFISVHYFIVAWAACIFFLTFFFLIRIPFSIFDPMFSYPFVANI